MARSVGSLMASGSISASAVARRSKSQKSKMTDFNDRGGDEGKGKDRGLYGSASMNQNQKKAVGSPIKASGPDKAPPTKVDHINRGGKKTAPGSKLGKADKTTTSHNTRMKGTKTASKNYYGGPNNRSA